MRRYYSMEQNERKATVTIYGDITSWPWLNSDVSAYLLSKQIEGLDVDEIDVFINSYGGEVAEGWAIYNALKRHKAKVHTYVDGFACSIASVIFMAGDIRTMSETSLLMIHQPSIRLNGTAEKLRKEAEVLDTIGELSAAAYKNHVNITDEELKSMLDNETWIAPAKAVTMGFATDVEQGQKTNVASQSAFTSVAERLTQKQDTAGVSLETIESVMRKCLKEVTAEKEPAEEKAVDLKKFFEAH